MQNSPLEFQQGAVSYRSSLPVEVLKAHLERWLRACRGRGHTDASKYIERLIAEKLAWFLDQRGYAICGQDEIEEFLAYCRESHLEPGGRWDAWNTRSRKPLSKAALRTYYNYVKIIFAYMVEQGVIEYSPLQRIKAPEYRPSPRTTFTRDQLQALFQAASKTSNARRDYAMVLLALDTGARAGEICGIRLRDLNPSEDIVWLFGKGEKQREVMYGAATASAIDAYLHAGGRHPEKMPHQPLFLSTRGSQKPLSPSGFLQVFKRLKAKAGMHGVRVNPHKMRATCITDRLEAGMPLRYVQEMVGHSTDRMTLKYHGTTSDVGREFQREHSLGDQILQPRRRSRKVMR